MIRPIMRSEFFLSQPCEPADESDLPIAHDLLDTLQAYKGECVGLAANMIGKRKRIIAVCDGPGSIVMINPVILSKAGQWQASESCLSLDGVRTATRYRTIKVSWQDMRMREHTKTYSGFVAQTIQHEVDHCDGIVI